MLFDVLNHLGIFRYTSAGRLVKEVIEGDFTIKDGVISASSLELKDGQYFAIIGSDLNDGVYQYGIDVLENETFIGRIYILRYNKSFFDLVEEMEQWSNDHASVIDSAYQSESFGGYSYTKDSAGTDVYSHFRKRLNTWRKV